MNKNIIKTNTPILAALIISAILMCGFVNMPHHFGMNMIGDIDMTNCPQCVKVAVVSGASINIAVSLLILFIALYTFANKIDQSDPKLRGQTFFKRITKIFKHLYNQLLILFSDGIIHPKIYSFLHIDQR